MKDKLYGLLKAKLFNHIFSLILAFATPFILYFLLFDDGSAYPPLVYMMAALCLFAIFNAIKDLSLSAKDYFVYMQNQTCEEITGKVVSMHKERGKNSHEYPVVRDEKTKAELILKISNVKDVILNRKYKFLYLENTKLAVIAETVWEDPNEGNDEYWTPPEADAWEDSDDEYWTPPKNDRESISFKHKFIFI